MRKFKFRIWDKNLAKYVTGVPAIPFDNNEYIIEQFTGAYDKNKKEIFEGDIIRGEEMYYDETTKKMKSYGVKVGHVWYYEDSPSWPISFNHPYSESSTQFNALWGKEVIGNILENEELLKND